MDYRDLEQNVPFSIAGFHGPIPLRRFPPGKTFEASNFLKSLSADALGISVQLSSGSFVESLALATSSQIVSVSFDAHRVSGPAPGDGDFNVLLGGFYATLAGFEMAHIALHLYRKTGYHIRGVDLSTLISPSTRKPWEPGYFITARVDSNVHFSAVNRLWETDGAGDGESVCLRAWISAIAVECSIATIDSTPKIDTRNLRKKELLCLGNLVAQSYLLQIEQPTEVKSEFSHVDTKNDGDLLLHNTRFSNRVRRSDKTSVVMTTTDGRELIGQATHSEGKGTTIKIKKGRLQGEVHSVRVVGRQVLTASERAQNEFILLVLRGQQSLAESPFTQLFWFPTADSGQATKISTPQIQSPATQTLNASQREVVAGMISETSSLMIAHGPPGTGKTTTISAAVGIWDSSDVSVWVVAQSNVAVKNIAESLLKRDVDFTLLVSKEFYVEWHEHIYEQVQPHILQADQLSVDSLAMHRRLGTCHVVLCTLSMLSNPILEDRRLFELIPMQKIVVHEASQIDIFEYMHLFQKFKKLSKVCLFGDPKQLPPYGQETVPSLQSVYSLKHLRSQAYFLNTQYRMPVSLGDFISENVYNNKLRSEHSISDTTCVAFIDVTKGVEKKNGHSWVNSEEIHTIVNLVRDYYNGKDFCIITPYDAQRAALEKGLKDSNLPWERVFNVDSFQGNEADYVLISVVRTASPGFLASSHRVNVMLTRCKLGMVIVTNRVFLHTTAAQYTLLGRLCQHWESLCGRQKTWRDWKSVVERTAELPGALAHHQSQVVPVSHPTKPLLAQAQVPPPRPTVVDKPHIDVSVPALSGRVYGSFPTPGEAFPSRLVNQNSWREGSTRPPSMSIQDSSKRWSSNSYSSQAIKDAGSEGAFGIFKKATASSPVTQSSWRERPARPTPVEPSWRMQGDRNPVFRPHTVKDADSRDNNIFSTFRKSNADRSDLQTNWKEGSTRPAPSISTSLARGQPPDDDFPALSTMKKVVSPQGQWRNGPGSAKTLGRG